MEDNAPLLRATRCPAEVEDHAMLLVEGADELAELPAQDALQWALTRGDHVHLHVPRAE